MCVQYVSNTCIPPLRMIRVCVPGNLGSHRDGHPCLGTDMNRNFDFHHGLRNSGTDPRRPCSSVYSGAAPASEVEVAAIQNFILGHGGVRVLFDSHSYGQLFLIPWGWTPTACADHAELMRVAAKAVAALRAVHGTAYEYGPSHTTIYPTSGTMDDWAHGVARVKYSFTLEARDRGWYGFLAPEAEIQPSGEETLAALPQNSIE